MISFANWSRLGVAVPLTGVLHQASTGRGAPGKYCAVVSNFFAIPRIQPTAEKNRTVQKKSCVCMLCTPNSADCAIAGRGAEISTTAEAMSLTGTLTLTRQ